MRPCDRLAHGRSCEKKLPLRIAPNETATAAIVQAQSLTQGVFDRNRSALSHLGFPQERPLIDKTIFHDLPPCNFAVGAHPKSFRTTGCPRKKPAKLPESHSSHPRAMDSGLSVQR